MIENNVIIYSNLDGDITKEYIDSGETIWNYEHSGSIVTDRLLIDEKVCFTALSNTICLNKNTGRQVIEINDNRVNGVSTLKNHDNNIVIDSQNGVLEVSLKNGEVLKHIDTNPVTLISEDPILYGNGFYILGGKFNGEQGLSKYSYKDQKEWTYPIDDSDHSIVSSISFIDENSIVFVTGRSPMISKIVSLDLNGNILWEQPYEIYSNFKTILPFENKMVFVSNNDLTFISSNTGELEKKVHLPKKYFNLKEVHGNYIILQNSDTVYLYNTADDDLEIIRTPAYYVMEDAIYYFKNTTLISKNL
ncbi:hypothetical protein [Nonlabens sp. Asnod3-A02]|uniref:hypothetical protein n=1 Tax=Nonlabens sp. Asnod3-A02 TaxID=3160579 RepID=UPI00386E672F